jgi:L-ascorbate metabolism protein UlaG (beta-lactamase superfamily)
LKESKVRGKLQVVSTTICCFMKNLLITLIILGAMGNSAMGQLESDVIQTSAGELEMFFVGHGTLMFTFNGLVIHIDPVMGEADYSKMPDADLILVTHQHGDHLDTTAINLLKKQGTRVIMTKVCMEQLEGFDAMVMRNGDRQTILGIGVEAVPAYNIQHTRPDGAPFHPKGEGNGYVLTFGDTRVLVAGDTENIPELKELKPPVNVAFLPMNLPYTMDPEMAADLARALHPAILYPYHYGNTDPQELVALLKGEDIDVRIRQLQ